MLQLFGKSVKQIKQISSWQGENFITIVAESAYIRLFMDWSRQSLPKPPAKYFTVKITPYYAISSECGEHINTIESGSTEYVISEMPEYENEDEKIAWLAMVG